MNNLAVTGKFLDQPILVSKFKKAVPALLTGGAVAYTAYDAMKEEKGKRKQRALKTGITLAVTVASALSAPRIASAITKRKLPPGLPEIRNKNKELIDTFIKNSKPNEETTKILEKGKDKILNFKEVKNLYNNLAGNSDGKKFLEKFIPSPENVSAKDIFSEIGYLSVFGAVPVLGGITGGIISDAITDREHVKEKIPDKIKEGSYQYLANIFMCNVGAGIALGIMEKAGIQSKISRAIGMTAGIIATGVIGGSKAANFIGEKVIDPVFNKKCNNVKDKKSDKRKPEALDIGLHTDDIATVSLLSGLKWIEPALPVMYTLSGYRAGIGYRN